jgi:AraC-like DNA-binding protein
VPLDSSLLAQARGAEARAINAEHDAEVLRTEFHRAIRRLQLAGGSLRELAQEFGLSHQRVHQIVEATGGSRSWGRPHVGGRELLSCSFCGRHQKQVKKLVTGPDTFICDGCITDARTVLAMPDAAVSTPVATIRRVSEEGRDEWCGFCGKSRRSVESMAAAADARICDECLDLCIEVISD